METDETRKKQEKQTQLLTGHLLSVSCHTYEYSFVSDTKNWSEALSYCMERSGTLATASSPEDMERLTKAATDKGCSGDFWIGLYDDVNSWHWSLGSSGDSSRSEEITFWNWLPSQPLDSKLENCAAFLKTGWESWPCETSHPFICYDEGVSDPYIPINMSVSFDKAQRYCRSHHTDLVTVRNQTENDWIETKVSSVSWIGLFRNGWRWTDDNGTAFHHWTSDQPVIGAKSCGLVSLPDGGRVENQWCSTTLPFVCRYRVVQRQSFRLKLQTESQVDMADPAVQAAILEQIQQRLLQRGLPPGEFRLSWKKQHDGQILKEEKEVESKGVKKKTEL